MHNRYQAIHIKSRPTTKAHGWESYTQTSDQSQQYNLTGSLIQGRNKITANYQSSRLGVIHSNLLGIRIRPPARQRKNKKQVSGGDQYEKKITYYDIHRMFKRVTSLVLVPGSNRDYNNPALLGRLRYFTPIRSTTRSETPSSGYTRSPDEISTNELCTSSWPETIFQAKTAAARGGDGGGGF
ncbi:hypothetical protein F511_28897 [Dorcoceras hygrometricum]|uniref:Uncharacterized protein n=1 Tax=Dorcoceras hygrometricum TaxID=472368 RepID=A0A2Z7CD90_9LAMI|nr:hypothetical protein F511_28897 [Dorcoceras hygrometricum]